MDRNEANSSTNDLLNAVRVIFDAELAKDTSAVSQLQRVLDVLPELKLDSERPEARQLPVCRHLSRTLDLGEAGPAASVAAAIRHLESTLEWQQNTRHTVELRGAEFMDNYAYSNFGLSGSTTLYVGVMLLGPGITYPVTSYPSEGVFLLIGGSPQWKSGNEAWRQVEAGDIICRPFDGAEGKRPGDEPMLALYAWMYR
ncbi:MAG: hypothetical protein IIA07_13545 [Proteobacteria bacterium]|nr:hypothetical protein [Pseudomonadota bacterium]